MRNYKRPEGLIRIAEDGKVTIYHEFSPVQVSKKSGLQVKRHSRPLKYLLLIGGEVNHAGWYVSDSWSSLEQFFNCSCAVASSGLFD
jgi:hypothetical protein